MPSPEVFETDPSRSVRPAVEPVLFSTIAFTPPAWTIFANLSPLAPMVVLVTSSALPVVVVRVFEAWSTSTVPPPVARKAALAPVDAVICPAKSSCVPVLFRSAMPKSLSVIGPANPTVPPFFPKMSTELPVPEVIEPA